MKIKQIVEPEDCSGSNESIYLLETPNGDIYIEDTGYGFRVVKPKELDPESVDEKLTSFIQSVENGSPDENQHSHAYRLEQGRRGHCI
jgi:hypothetical protein